MEGYYAGLMTGADSYISSAQRVGLFGGFAHSRFKAESGGHVTETNTLFGGGYSRWERGAYWSNLALLAGITDNDLTRYVANNLVVGGLETGKSDYNGAFISPALTVGRQLGALDDGTPLLGSLRLHYAAMFMDGHSETGVTNSITVGDRDVHSAGARLEFALPSQEVGRQGETLRYQKRFGLDYQFSPKEQTINSTIAGLPLNFDADLNDKNPGAFFGGGFSRVSADGMSEFQADVLGRVDTAGSAEIGVQLSFKKAF